MSVLPRYRGAALRVFAVALALLVLTVSVEVTGAAPDRSPSGLRSATATNPCPGALLPTDYSGTVQVDGAPSTSPVSLTARYDAVVTTNLTSGLVLSSVCSAANTTATSNAAGTFALAIEPTITCGVPPSGIVSECVTVSGPYEQVQVAPTPPLPAGDFSEVTQNGTAFQVRIDAYLASVRLDPGPPSATFSPGGVDEFHAQPLTGAGNATPMVPQFDWTLSGTGWTFVAPPNGSAVNVTAAVGAGIGNLSVYARLNVTGGALVTPRTSEQLLAVATTISSASLNRTVLDVGQSVSAEVNGSAAAGYPYSAEVEPGFGEPAAPARCTSSPATTGTVSVACAATLTYGEAGVAQPAMTVSNGVSSAVWQFPEVTVNPALTVAFSPSSPAGYTNEGIPIGVTAGTGTAPYSEACLSTVGGAAQCIGSPGPSWTFAVARSSPGTYPLSAWVVDAAGVQRAATTVLRVVAPLAVTLVPSTNGASAGSPLAIVGDVSGGVLPVRVWWNATGASNPVASAWVASDGPVQATFVPPTAGFVTVSVVAVDGLGTVATAVETWTVGVGAATAAVPVVLPPTSPVPAGAPFGVAWEALDSGGDVVRDFTSLAEIELAAAGTQRPVSGWVNASGVGPLASPLPGWFDVPASAWIGGDLNVSVTSRVAGTIDIELVVAAGIVSTPSTEATVVLPDIDHLRLFDPRTVLSGDRTNDTLWQVTDRFGNPASGASVVVASSCDGSTVDAFVPVLSEPNGSTDVWVNYSVPGAWEGIVRVTDLAGDLLLPPIAVPGFEGAWGYLATIALAGAVAVGTATALAAVVRARSRRPVPPTGPRDDEAALQWLAEGRANVVELLRRWGPLDLAGVATAWEPPPAPPELADWIASLLTDGTLDATFGADGVARFCVATGGDVRTQVTLDVAAFDRAQRQRDVATGAAEEEDL